MYNEKRHSMDQEYQNLFNGWEAQPPADMWQKIELKLDGKDNKKPFFWWWAGRILLPQIILVSAGVWFLLHSSFIPLSEQPTDVVKNQITSTKTVNEDITNSQAKVQDDKNQLKKESLTGQDSVKTDVNKGNLAENKNNTTVSKKSTYVNTFKTNGNEGVYISSNSPGTIKKTTSTIPIKIEVQASSGSQKPIEQRGVVPKTDSNNTEQSTTLNQKQTTPVSIGIENNKQTKELSAGKDSVSATDSLTTSTLPSAGHQQPMISATTKSADSSAGKENRADTISKPKIDSALLVKKDSVPQQNKIPAPDTAEKPSLAVNVPKDTSKIKKPGGHLLSLSVYGSPELGNNTVSANSTIFDIKSEKTSLQFDAGFRASFKLGNRIEISIAAAYSQAGISYQSNQGLYFDRYTDQPYIFSSSYGDMAVPHATMLMGFSPLAPPSLTQFMLHGYQYSQTIQFINIPLSARFNITMGKLKTYASIGINMQYAIGEKAQVEIIKELETDVINYNTLNTTKLNFAPMAAVGIQYDFAKHIGIYLEPNARYNILSSSANASVKSNASFIDCLIGLRVNL